MCVPNIASSRFRPMTSQSSAVIEKQNVAVTPPASPLPMSEQNDIFGEGSISPSSCTFKRKRNSTNNKSFSRLAHHDYHDHSHDAVTSENDTTSRRSATDPFPIQLHMMLDTVEREGYAHVVSWQPHGRCFVIHDQKQFHSFIMPKFMKQTKFPSFRRQLNLYGFQRLSVGPDRGGYYHELFLRGRPFLARRMQRQCNKGTRVRCRSNPEEEPNFYNMEPVVANEMDIAMQDEQMDSGHCEMDNPDFVASCVPSDDDVAFFAGKSFHMIQENRRMDNLLQTLQKENQFIPVVEDDANDDFLGQLEMICGL
mmetsp:Transcript_19475/g.29282  ORF Transcript_19475/g.29282 Transcript_19475/m.29282 type:complete len:310 (+) Transcript_19475:115-1044(+)